MYLRTHRDIRAFPPAATRGFLPDVVVEIAAKFQLLPHITTPRRFLLLFPLIFIAAYGPFSYYFDYRSSGIALNPALNPVLPESHIVKFWDEFFARLEVASLRLSKRIITSQMRTTAPGSFALVNSTATCRSPLRQLVPSRRSHIPADLSILLERLSLSLRHR